MQRVDHPDPAAANAQAREDVENGSTGLVLVFESSVSANGFGLGPSATALARVLDGIDLRRIVLDLNLSPATRGMAREVAALVKTRGIEAGAVDLRFSLNPIGGFAATGRSPQSWEKLAPAFAAMVAELANDGFRGPFAVADGRVVHNAGGSEAQELAFALASAVAYLCALERSGMPLETAFGAIYFRLTADADQFLTTAKFRAVRKLWARIGTASGLSPKPAIVTAETAWRMLTRRDAYVNILRNTIAVAAAGPMRSRRCRTAQRSVCRMPLRAVSRVTCSSSCWRNPIWRALAILPRDPAPLKPSPNSFASPLGRNFKRSKVRAARGGRLKAA